MHVVHTLESFAMPPLPFESIYRHGFVRAAVCIPFVRLGSPIENADRTIALARRAHDAHAALALFPELGLSGYSNEDLFHQDALLETTLSGLGRLVDASRTLTPILIAGAPLRFEQKLFNCGVVIHHGRILGITPKTYLPNYREFYERRQFTPGTHAVAREVAIFDTSVPFGNDLIYDVPSIPGCALHVEVCEDLWVPMPPSSYAAIAGATILANLSASNITIGKADYRRMLCASQSGRCIAAYLYSAAGSGESTTDLAWDGHGMIYENSQLLAETMRFATDEQVILADIDLERLVQERVRMTSFNDAARELRERTTAARRVSVSLELPDGAVGLARDVERFPYVPSDPAARD